MRGFVIFVLLLLVAVALIGYERQWFRFSATSDDRNADVNIALDKDRWHHDRDEFSKQADAQLKDLKKKLDELRDKAATSDAQTRHALDEKIQEINKKFQTVREEVNELDHATQEKWQEFKPRLNHAMEDLKKGISKAADRLR